MLCVQIPTRNGDSDGTTWRRAILSNAGGGMISVSDVLSILPRKLGKNVGAEVTFTVVNVLLAKADRLKFVPADSLCKVHVGRGLVDEIVLASVGSVRKHQVSGMNYTGSFKACLKLSDTGNPSNGWEEVSDTESSNIMPLTVSVPVVEFMSPSRVVKTQENTYFLNGHGLHSGMEFKLVQVRF